jgi:hypothetical protein
MFSLVAFHDSDCARSEDAEMGENYGRDLECEASALVENLESAQRVASVVYQFRPTNYCDILSR